MSRTIFLGSFDAENFWRDPGLSRLPYVPDPTADRIVAAMDESLFLFCRTGDLLITRFPMEKAFDEYLAELGYVFSHYHIDHDNESAGSSIFDLLTTSENHRILQTIITENTTLSPYAVLPGTPAFCDLYGLAYQGPDPCSVAEVNSKLYSHALSAKLGLNPVGAVVTSHRELQTVGLTLLAQGPVLIKDPYGVSGRGNLLVQSRAILERISSHIARQEEKGKVTRFLVEPFLEKEWDFSCQFRIHADGGYEFYSLQMMMNIQLAYRGSRRATPELCQILETRGYFLFMKQIAAELYHSGYYGEVCVDSMLLKDGTLIPIVEINARKSMGLINDCLDRFLAGFGLTGSLTFIPFAYAGGLNFSDLLQKMKSSGLLYHPGAGFGLIPLTSRTPFINQPVSVTNRPQVFKGRFYFALVGDGETQENLRNRCVCLLTDLGFIIH